ncbi:hypothetical protein HPB48_008962 [Haemaphysalis longicornis]|uniref:Phospholipid scramblase n=1 Tax=Haemaphysalis longicornis TaxID=44386 RepID=A0A9J6GMU4_HAELO|nr:hypothetical protein HPB48_008962 [Haemaphysalis longicornis]
MDMVDYRGEAVVHVIRPLRCAHCWCFCCLQQLQVQAPPGTLIGSVSQKWSLCYPIFTVYDRFHKPTLTIAGPFCTQSLPCACDVKFEVRSLNGVAVGTITKKWSGLVKELFTDADNFGVSFPMDLDVNMKATLLAATMLILHRRTTMDCATLATVVQVAMDLVDSDSEDEEFDDLVAALAVKLVRIDRNRIPLYCEEVVGRYFELEFKRMFRLSRETFNDLADRYQASAFFPEFYGGRPRISAQKTCLAILTYLGNQCNMYSIADRFDISESSVHACIERVLNLLHSLSAEVISWPYDSNGYILGDCAYLLLPCLMTPYKDTAQSFPTWKKKYNKCHSQQRVAIEVVFGLLKQRFRRLYLVDTASIKQCCLIIMGACVLHNLCNDERDLFDELQDLPDLEKVGNSEESGVVVDSSVAGYSECLRKKISEAQYICIYIL